MGEATPGSQSDTAIGKEGRSKSAEMNHKGTADS